MDAYLAIAEAVLKIERRPLSSVAILAAAYRHSIVPPHLHGRTQHKTVGARISEDIVERRDKSVFFRTEPGKFFLREFLTDTTIPVEHRQPIATRRRVRELVRGPALALSASNVRRLAPEGAQINPDRVLELLRKDGYRYDDPRHLNRDSMLVWSFVSVRRKTEVLSYRVGRYREDRDSFLSRRSIGFSSLVYNDDHTLFNMRDFGIVDSGVNAMAIDLDMPEVPASKARYCPGVLCSFIWTATSPGVSDLIALINFQCPEWFEPVKRRLAINDLRWLDARHPPNNVDDFDPWSKMVLLAVYSLDGASNFAPASYAPSE
ncbi:MAG TPA: hypothetical protein VHB49_10300 [Bradyrhizobium sp.]|nr:hypothetical protein [Bradyrhizobium sp.]